MSPSAELVLATLWWLLGLSLMFVCMRIYVRLQKLHTPFLISDYLAALAWVLCLVVTIVDTQVYYGGAFDTIVDYTDDNLDDPTVGSSNPDSLVLVQKFEFASALFYDVGLFFPKFSLLASYFIWISPVFPRLRIALYILTAYACISCLAIFFLDMFWCVPVAKNWSLDWRDCHVITDDRDYSSTWAMNITSDIPIFILPLFLLKYLQFGRTAFIGALGMFLLGFITIITTITRFIVITLTSQLGIVYILYGVEFNASIIVICLPSLKVFVTTLRPGSQANPSNFSSGYMTKSGTQGQSKLDDAKDGGPHMSDCQWKMEFHGIGVEEPKEGGLVAGVPSLPPQDGASIK